LRALVTGCAGFIGSHLVDSLLADGGEVQGVDCFTENYSRAEKLRNLQQARDWNSFSLADVDLAEADLDKLLEAADVVFHLAAEPGVRSSWGSRFDVHVRNNVTATQRLLEALKAWPEKRFVLASSSSVYGQAERLPTAESTTPRPLSPYGVTKLAAEHLVQLYAANYGLEPVSLRYFSVYGPRQRPDMAFHQFFRAALDGKPVTIFGDGSQVRDFTFVADVIEATRAAAELPVIADIVNVGAGTQVSLARTLELIASLAGRALNIVHTPSQRGDVKATGADTTLACEHLRYEPRVQLDEGLGMQFQWMLGNEVAATVGSHRAYTK
jgi:UDP-glucuronate 4-epimerase